MERTTLVRLQLIALAVITLAVIFRIFGGAPRSSGLVVMEGDLEAHRLSRATMHVEEPLSVQIHAVGSFLDGENLAAYGWIFNREEREVAWKMTPESVERKRRTLAVAQEKMQLEAGTYDVYFASYGDQDVTGRRRRGALAGLFRQRSERWTADAKRWKLTITAADRRRAVPVRVLERDPAAGEAELTVWEVESRRAGGPFGLLRADRAVALHVYALGEIAGERRDVGRIEHLESGAEVWSFDEGNTAHAGGGRRNRVFDGEIKLGPGTYRVDWKPHRTRGGWQVNPPFDASGLGLRLAAASPGQAGAVSVIDPWENLVRFADLTEVGNNRRVSAAFSVDGPVPVVVYATGEGSGRRMYDYGWIYDHDRGRRVWEMEIGETFHAGGARKNRAAMATLRLEPGTYTATYVTDGSHAYGDWNAARPEHPERWGLALFALGEAGITVLSHDTELPGEQSPDDPELPRIPGMPDIDLEALRLEAQEAAAEALREVESLRRALEPAAAPTRAGEYTRTLVNLTRLSDNVHRQATFTLDRRTSVHVYAVGEIMLSGRFDYGWIEDARGRKIWEMTIENTRHAGGARKNRKADEVITLPAGTYTVHFRTDDSHAFGSFNQDPPDDPEAWGITVRKRER